MKKEIKEVLVGILEDKTDTFVDNVNIDSITDDIIASLKQQGYYIKKIVKFKVGDVIGTDCGNWVDTIITKIIDGDIMQRAVPNGDVDENGDLYVYDTNSYDELIEKGYRVKR
jgi:hypothetical protein